MNQHHPLYKNNLENKNNLLNNLINQCRIILKHSQHVIQAIT